jgi:K+-transporting ATPase ATPase C chain
MKEIRTALFVLAAFTLILGVVYPLIVTGIGQLAFPWRANGSLVTVDGHTVGSELIGQTFASPEYFHGRPSPSGYDPMASGASNLGPSNPTLHQDVRDRVNEIRQENDLPAMAFVPSDLVLASGSGLDPEISVEGALLQVPRIAAARGLAPEVVGALVKEMRQGPFLGAFGEPRVNVLRLNLALDERSSDALPEGSSTEPTRPG